jgi:hypothetical protein
MKKVIFGQAGGIARVGVTLFEAGGLWVAIGRTCARTRDRGDGRLKKRRRSAGS